jgi:hypothetical protein
MLGTSRRHPPPNPASDPARDPSYASVIVGAGPPPPGKAGSVRA